MHCIVIGFFLLDLPFVPNWKKKNSKIGMHPPQEHTHQSFTLTSSFFSFFDLFLLGPLFQSAWQNQGSKCCSTLVFKVLLSFKKNMGLGETLVR
jgi:hypothetical protein